MSSDVVFDVRNFTKTAWTPTNYFILSPSELTTSWAFFVGDVNIFGMRLFIKIRYFFVNNRSVFVLGLFSLIGTVSTSLNLAKERVRSATIITHPSGSRFCKIW